MTLVAYLNGTDQAHRIKIGDMGLSSRADGGGAFGQIIFDDPDGTLEVRGFMHVRVEETDCTEAPVQHWGWIWERTYKRGPYTSGPSRIIDCQVLDPNYALNHQLITGLDGKRDPESDIERVDWMLESAYINGVVRDFGLVDRHAPHPMEEASYLGERPANVMEDLSGQLWKAWYAYVDQTEDALGLFYDIPIATTATSDLTISNRIEDQSDTCYYPFLDAELNRNPEAVYSKMRFKYRNGVVLSHNDDTYNEFFADTGLGHRGVQVESTRVGLESTARSRAATLLARASKESDTITCSIQIEPENVGLIQAGQRIGLRFTHLDGYQDTDEFTYSRVTARTIHQIRSDLYQMDLELNADGVRAGAGGGGGGEFPHEPPPDQSPDVTGDVCNTVIEDSIRTGEADIGGLAVEGEFWYFEVVQTSHTAGAVVTGLELTSVGVAPDLLYDLLSLWTPVEIGTGAGSPPLPLRSGTFFVGPQTVGGAAQFHLRVDADYLGPGVTVDECFHIEMWKGGPPTTETPPPDPGQEVPWAVVDMTIGDTFSIGATQFGYAFDTLKVKVDGVLISPASIEQTDPACGLFKLLWVIDDDEVVTVSYDGI